ILYIDNFSTNGQAFNLTWQLTAGASLDCSVLPVSFLNVQATQQLDQVALNWTTQGEKATDRYLIERSSDGLAFAPIGTTDAIAIETPGGEHQFLDKTPRNGQNHYRIIRLEQDGTEHTSNSVMVHFRSMGTSLVLVPNPAQDRINLYMTPVDEELQLRLLDATGRLLRTWVEGTALGPITFAVDELDAGAYTILVSTAAGTHLGHAAFVKE
ncbi:MAG: T9SS type A sorting domain-containing protein, partial [Flavobacteriales bacterium]|nr:T9SS type A sorting domain-containing protein [Flavobacteriales bacterium]